MNPMRRMRLRGILQTVFKWTGVAIVALDVLLIGAVVVQLGRLTIVNNAIDIWFDRSDPSVRMLDEERRIFGADTWMLATVWLRPDSGGVDTAEVARSLTAALERVRSITRVLSPTSIEVLQENEQGLFYDRLDSQLKWAELRERLLKHPVARNLLVYDNAPGMFSLLIREQNDLSMVGADRQRLMAEVRGILDNHPAVDAAAVSGVAVINAGLNSLSWGDFITLMPATFVLASLVLLVVLRFRRRTTLAVMAPVSLGALGLIASMLLVGRPLTVITIALPGLIFTLGMASSLHLTGWVAAWLRERPRAHERVAAAALQELLRPMLVSQITTALGFGALAIVQVRPVQDMALFGAAGVLYSSLHVLFVLPKCLHWLGAMNELEGDRPLFAGDGWIGARLEGLSNRLGRMQRRRYWVLAGTAALCVGIVWLLSMVRYDSTYLNMFGENVRLRRDYARFEAAGLPSSELSVVIRRNGESGVVDATMNDAIRKATEGIEALPGVFKVVGPAEIFAEVAPALAGDQSLDTFERDDASVTDAYIFALSGGNTEIGSYVHDGLDAYRLVVFFPYVENSKLQELAAEIRAVLNANFHDVPQVSTELSGVAVSWANMDDAISRGQVTSLVFMALTCFVSFFLSLRDWRLAASSTLVNVLPVGMVGALLGATGRPIDMATVFIMSIALGIADDDTSFFVHECVERPGRSQAALTATMRQNGPKMIAACIVIVVGFSMLLISSFTPMQTFGGLTALGLVMAVLCDVFLLPFLLVAFPHKGRQIQRAGDAVGGDAVLALASPGSTEEGDPSCK